MPGATTICGSCGAENPEDAVVCVQCGALLAAYRAAPEPIQAADTPVAPAPSEPEPLPEAAQIRTPVPTIGAPPPAASAPGSAAASIFGASAIAAASPVVTPYEFGKIAQALAPAPRPLAVPGPKPVERIARPTRVEAAPPSPPRPAAASSRRPPAPRARMPTIQEFLEAPGPALRAMWEIFTGMK